MHGLWDRLEKNESWEKEVIPIAWKSLLIICSKSNKVMSK